MKFKITFSKEFEGKDASDCCDKLIKHLHRCVKNARAIDFDFLELPNKEISKTMQEKGE